MTSGVNTDMASTDAREENDPVVLVCKELLSAAPLFTRGHCG